MPIDYTKYDLTKPSSSWKPPVPDSEMELRSAKIKVTAVVYPEFLLAAYALFEQQFGVKPTSMSEILRLALSQLLNDHLDGAPIPTPDRAKEFFTSIGFMTGENKRHIAPFARANQKQEQMETRVGTGQASLREHYDYLNSRSPEAAQEYLTRESQASLDKYIEETPEETQQDRINNGTATYQDYVYVNSVRAEINHPDYPQLPIPEHLKPDHLRADIAFKNAQRQSKATPLSEWLGPSNLSESTFNSSNRKTKGTVKPPLTSDSVTSKASGELTDEEIRQQALKREQAEISPFDAFKQMQAPPSTDTQDHDS